MCKPLSSAGTNNANLHLPYHYISIHFSGPNRTEDFIHLLKITYLCKYRDKIKTKCRIRLPDVELTAVII